MGKKTYEEFLIESHPGISAIAHDYAALGVAKPILWAKAELDGAQPYAAALFGYAMRSEINPADDHRWVTKARTGAMNFENATLHSQTADAVRYLEESGIDMSRLTPLIRAVQTQCVKQIASMLDEGPEILCLDLPDGRQAHWGLFSVSQDETIDKQIGVREALNDPGEL